MIHNFVVAKASLQEQLFPFFLVSLTTRKQVYGNKTFCHTKVSISSLDVLGDEIVHQATKIVSSTNVGSRIVLATKYFCRLILSTFRDEFFRRLLISSPKQYLATNFFSSPKVHLSTKHDSSPKKLQMTKLIFVAIYSLCEEIYILAY